ncbi:hypothetical protein BD309DRAFT_84710 [Dichomitus squalens]|uniref:Uncharacterized protein n=1 Tax=Dichomitus squalens TaxID=114155 RepID=A0A4Q9MYV0_9APHY|nr:hypothetical protein BD311DRAFT_546912 [Dichomitus squalens]TBU43766.1 hypothetical protein BD309DRAFT_84710 [Dichomitus squalens]
MSMFFVFTCTCQSTLAILALRRSKVEWNDYIVGPGESGWSVRRESATPQTSLGHVAEKMCLTPWSTARQIYGLRTEVTDNLFAPPCTCDSGNELTSVEHFSPEIENSFVRPRSESAGSSGSRTPPQIPLLYALSPGV